MAKEVNKRVNVWINGKEVENNIKSIRSAMIHLTNQMNKMEIGSEEYIQTSKKLRDLKTIYDEHCKSLKMTNQEIENNTTSWKKNIIHWGAFSATVQGASAAVQRFVSATQEYVDAYATLDDAMTNVSKYTGLTREEVKQLNEEFRKMDTRTPTEKLNALAADAGRLGITSKEAIKDFVEAADIINVALGEDLGEDAVKEIGKLAEMFGTTETMGLRGAMLATGSAINTLAQSSSASERYLMDFTSRLAGAANQAQISQANILGFASVLDQNKQQVEMSATALQKLLMNMFTVPEKYARLAGVSVQEFADALKNDANEALISFLDTLNKKGGLSELAPIFKDLGLDGARASGVISVLAGKIDDVREAQATANAAFAEGNSVINEAAAVNGNAAAQLDKAKKAVQDAKAALGEELLPVITQLTQTSASGLRTAAAVVKFLTQHKGLVIGLGVAYGALHAAQKLVIAAQKEHVALSIKGTAVGNAYKSVVMLLATAKAKLAGSTAAATLAQKEFKAAFAATPWGAVIVAIGAVATGMGMLISKHREARKAAEEFNTEVAKEQAEAQYLFEKLKKTEKGTDDYREALAKLKEKYPEIIQKHLDEEGALRDVEQAYKDVIVQIKAKIAEQLKEQKITDATTTLIDEQTKQMERLQKQLKKDGRSDSEIADIQATIREYANSGKSMKELSDKLLKDFNYYFSPDAGTDQRNPVKKFLAAQADYDTSKRGLDQMFDGFIEDGKKASDEIAQIDDKIANLQKQMYGENRKEIQKQIEDLKKLKQQKLDTAKAGSGTDPDKPTPPGSGDGGTKKAKKDPVADFEKKLQEFRARQQRETLDGWEKTKQEVMDSYQKMIDEAEELNLTDKVKELEDERTAAIAAAGQKYLETNGKILEDFSRKIQDWGKDLMPESGNEVLDALLGTEQKWAQRFTEVQKQSQDLLDLRELFVTDNIDTSSLDALINKLGDEMNGMADMEAKDIQKTLEKYQTQTDDFIKAEQKSITDATLTERQRQKNAIEEKYRLEIEYIEKQLAARIAAYGEDDPEVKQLREKIKLLNKLKGQQQANVSSGQKTVWQQLAEFDWSKLSDNWQDALDLMDQGLQEFASAAFDIYGSIAQIQDNMMQAELQKTQEAYDAKSAALKRQLDQGVISQKAYDAKMQKLTEEKEKKEKKLKHEQFAREKAANIVQALINGALAITNIWAQWADQPIVAAVLTAVAAATNAVQIAAIATQPNPYAKGGYIRGRQYAVMGEQGDEWVASNKLLRDKEAATVIAALDDYQKGNRNALANISFATPDPKIMSQAVSGNGRTFAPSNQTTNNYYQNSDNSELLKEMRQMNDFLRDPNNRRAYISRKIQLEFDEQEEEIRSMARL